MRRRISFTVEKNRVLVPVGEPCPFGCRYCYTRGGEVGLSRVKMTDILTPFQRFVDATPFETIQFGYDGDPFARPERGLAMLWQLAMMGKNVNFSTKALLEGPTIDALCQMQQMLESEGRTLSALVSLSCWDSSPWVEPHTPSPRERIMTITNLKRSGIPVFIAVRPVLPHIPDSEYERIAEEGVRAGCDGLILGPLYADEHEQFVRFIPKPLLATVQSQKGTVPWSAHTPIWTRYEDTERLQKLVAMIERKGGRTFLSSADAMAQFQRQKEEVA